MTIARLTMLIYLFAVVLTANDQPDIHHIVEQIDEYGIAHPSPASDLVRDFRDADEVVIRIRRRPPAANEPERVITIAGETLRFHGELDINGRTIPASDQERIIILGNERGVRPYAAKRGDIYQVFVEHPEQTFLDTKLGPMPFWTDVAIDANGESRPRFPSLYVKMFLDNPTEETALAYLVHGMARWRRIKEANAIMRRTAAKHGIVLPGDYDADPLIREEPLQYQLGKLNPTADHRDDGVPMLTPEQAISQGLDPQDIPISPGICHDVEVLYLWDPAVNVSRMAMKDFSLFCWDLKQIKSKISLKTVAMRPPGDRSVRRDLDYLKGQFDILVHKMENLSDHTKLRASLRIDVVPTYVFVDRRRGRVERWSGTTDQLTLRQKLLQFLAIPRDQQVWPPKTEWFLNERDRKLYESMRPAPASDSQLPDQTAGDAGVLPPPQDPIRPWNR